MISDNTKITLTVDQLRRLVRECNEFEIQSESFKTALTVPVMAGLLAIGNIVRPEKIRAEVPTPNATQEQVQNAARNAVKTLYGGFPAALATNIVVRTIFWEGRGETPEGRKMIATVIWNRAGGNADRFAEECLKPQQFSVWNKLANRTPKGVNVKIPGIVTTSGVQRDIWTECQGLVESLFDGTFVPLGDWNAYLNKETASRKAVDGWGTKMTNQKKVGRHTFGYLPEHDGFNEKTAVKPPVYPTSYTVKKGDLGVSYVAKWLVNNKQTPYTSVSKLTDEIIRLNSFKKDKKGNPIIHPGDKIKLPAK